MLRPLCTYLLICATLSVHAQHAFVDTNMLGNFSYLLYGKTHSGCTVQATAALIRSNGRLYMVTACHVINGWYYESYDKEDSYPDTLLLRVFSRKGNHVNFIPIDIHKLKHIKPPPGWPDIYFYPLNISSAYRVNTLESISGKGKTMSRTPEDILVYGYQITVDSDNVDFKKLPVTKATVKWCGQSWAPYTYTVSYPGNALGPGNSGSPVFFSYKMPSGMVRPQFGGILIGGASASHTATILRPELIWNLLKLYTVSHKSLRRAGQ